MRAEAVESYRALPLPDTTEEHWRFTDLKDFDPTRSRSCRSCAAARHRDEAFGDDARAGRGRNRHDHGEPASRSRRAPDGVTFEPLTEEHERLYS